MKQMGVLVVVLAAAACSKKSSSPPASGSGSAVVAPVGSAEVGSGSAVVEAGSAAPATPHCLERKEEMALVAFGADDKIATLCIAPENIEEGAKVIPTCASVELATGTWSAANKPLDPPPPPASEYEVKQDAKGVHVCKGSECKTLAAKPPKATEDGIDSYSTAVSADGKRVILASDSLKGAELYDATTGKKVKFVKLTSEDEGCLDSIAFVGDYVYLSTNVCAGPGAEGAFYNWAGKRVAKLEGVNPYGVMPIDLGGGVYAFEDLDGGGIALFDAKAGKARAIEIPQREEPCEECSWLTATAPDGLAGTAKTPGGKLVVANMMGVYVLDPVANKIEKTYPYPICGAKK